MLPSPFLPISLRAANATARPEFIKFLRYSKGSCGELRTQLYIAERVRQKLAQPSVEGSREMISETRKISKMLQSLITSLKRRLNDSSTDH